MFPQSQFELEFTFLFLYFIVERFRLFALSKGNKTERKEPVIQSIVFSLGTLLLNVYYLQLQTYVANIELVLNAMCIAIIGLEDIIGLIYSIAYFKM